MPGTPDRERLAGIAWRLRTSLASIIAGILCFTYFREVRDLLLDRMGAIGLGAFAALALTVWAVPIYLSSARALEREWHDVLRARKVPILMGLMPFLTILLGLYLVRADITRCEEIRTRTQLEECFAAPTTQDRLTIDDMQSSPNPAASLVSVSEVPASLARLRIVALATAASALAFLALVIARPRVREGIERLAHAPTAHVFERAARAFARMFRLRPDIGAAILSVGLLFWAFYWPAEFTDIFGRAALLPVLLGSWVALITALSTHFGPRTRKVLAGGVFAVVVLSTAMPGFHDVRLYRSQYWPAAQGPDLSATSTGPAERQMLLADAIDLWMAANKCTGNGRACPRIVLVAAEGGASRSAFFVGTVLGALLDKTRQEPDVYPDLASALFAMSGVSGGALGLATTRTALIDATGRDPPCRVTDSLWFAGPQATGDLAGRDIAHSWRACLQLLTAGDYLSPTIVGLGVRDNFAALVPEDRAVLLERAIERHYNGVVYDDRTACGGPEDGRGFCRPFGYLKRFASKRWLPLLLLNATAVEWGRPILASDFYTAVAGCSDNQCTPLFSTAHNLFELFKDPAIRPDTKADSLSSPLVAGLRNAQDIRLSTATVLSARFPLVSPAGILRYVDEHKDVLTARVVDGGYFDNSGLESLGHLLPFLLERELRPLLIYLANEPWSSTRYERPGHSVLSPDPDQLWETRLTRLGDSFWSRAIALVAEPLRTLNKTRSGHVEATKERFQRLHDGGQIRFVSVRVMESIRPVHGNLEARSLCIDNPNPGPLGRITLYQPVMSWWLSALSQRALDAQLCDFENANAVDRILESLKFTEMTR